MNFKILRYLGAIGSFSVALIFLFALINVIPVTATTDFSKIMKPVDIILLIGVASISIGIGVGCLKEELFPNKQPNLRKEKQ